MATTLSSIVNFLNQLLDVKNFDDAALNGLQIESGKTEIKKVAFAVDSGLSVIESAVKHDADMLVVHHGMLWGQQLPLTGIDGRKVRTLMTSGCSLYAAHLPLDAHLEVGNAAGLAKHLGLEKVTSFFDYRGSPIGVRGEFKSPLPFDEIAKALSNIEGALKSPLLLPFGKTSVTSVGILTGSGSSGIDQCVTANIDLFVSGEPKQSVFHHLKENGQSAIFAGHYATETFGVRALEKMLSQRFRIDTYFVDEPTGI